MQEPVSKPERTLDLEALKGLAHPLRLQIFDALSVHGPATASGLAERFGESSGATSYHLRQLERHGFVREVEGRGTGRERWWERTPGSVAIEPRQLDDSPVTRAASDLVMRQWSQSREQALENFIAHGLDDFGDEWIDDSMITLTNVRLTPGQLKEVVNAWQAHMQPLLDSLRGHDDAGSRPVQIHFNAFPVVGGIETPERAGK
ncbi:MAG: helix-turn-helix domain-containing protein [Actinomycetota bacterium]